MHRLLLLAVPLFAMFPGDVAQRVSAAPKQGMDTARDTDSAEDGLLGKKKKSSAKKKSAKRKKPGKVRPKPESKSKPKPTKPENPLKKTAI